MVLNTLVCLWSPLLILWLRFLHEYREARCEMPVQGSESHLTWDSCPGLGSQCERSPQMVLLDDAPVPLTLKPVLGNVRGGGGWRRRPGGSRVDSWGDLSHPLHTEEHFCAGGEKRCPCCRSLRSRARLGLHNNPGICKHGIASHRASTPPEPELWNNSAGRHRL